MPGMNGPDALRGPAVRSSRRNQRIRTHKREPRGRPGGHDAPDRRAGQGAHRRRHRRGTGSAAAHRRRADPHPRRRTPLAPVVDSYGAGDAFAAAFLSGFLRGARRPAAARGPARWRAPMPARCPRPARRPSDRKHPSPKPLLPSLAEAAAPSPARSAARDAAHARRGENTEAHERSRGADQFCGHDHRTSRWRADDTPWSYSHKTHLAAHSVPRCPVISPGEQRADGRSAQGGGGEGPPRPTAYDPLLCPD